MAQWMWVTFAPLLVERLQTVAESMLGTSSQMLGPLREIEASFTVLWRVTKTDIPTSHHIDNDSTHIHTRITQWETRTHYSGMDSMVRLFKVLVSSTFLFYLYLTSQLS